MIQNYPCWLIFGFPFFLHFLIDTSQVEETYYNAKKSVHGIEKAAAECIYFYFVVESVSSVLVVENDKSGKHSPAATKTSIDHSETQTYLSIALF